MSSAFGNAHLFPGGDLLATADVPALERALAAARARSGALPADDDDGPDGPGPEQPQPGPHHFEGPEKNLEVDFTPGVGPERGCRALSRAQLDELCAAARCEILTHVSNAHVDAYVLSESSLFVFRSKVVMKTCGTTTLLRCLPLLLQFAGELGLELEWLGYSRSNYSLPSAQRFPHGSFDQEIGYLRQVLGRGEAYVLGPVTADHWHVFVDDVCERPPQSSTDRTLSIMLFGMPEDVLAQFHAAEGRTAADVTRESGIGDLVPGAIVDAFLFSPCGYSMNAVLYDAYSTIHVTPETEFSYASFETSQKLASYSSLVSNVLAAFRPQRFVVTLFADECGLAELVDRPFAHARLAVPGVGTYHMKTTCGTSFEGDYSCTMGCWSLQSAVSPKERRVRAMSVPT